MMTMVKNNAIMATSSKILWMVLLMLLTMSMDAAATIYNWSRYDLSFETPEGGFVTFNSPTRFEVQWEDMVMTVQLYSKDKGDEKKMLNENLQRKALGYSMYDLHDGKIKVKGFKKTYSIGFAENKSQQPNHERKHQKVQKRHQAEKEKAKKQSPEKPPRKEKLYDA